jgi:hypothetical protein
MRPITATAPPSVVDGGLLSIGLGRVLVDQCGLEPMLIRSIRVRSSSASLTRGVGGTLSRATPALATKGR